MKMMRISTVFVICFSILLGSLCVPITVQAEGNEGVESRMTYISSYTTSLSISDTGMATITGLVRGKSGVTSTYVKCTLQMSVGGGWVDVKSWEVTSADNGATLGETYQLSSRGTYRVYMECGANTEEKTLISAYRTY